MSSPLDELHLWIDRPVTIVTCDGRVLCGILRGFDQTLNVIVSDSHEKTYQTGQGEEEDFDPREAKRRKVKEGEGLGRGGVRGSEGEVDVNGREGGGQEELRIGTGLLLIRGENVATISHSEEDRVEEGASARSRIKAISIAPILH